ncbi:hypothetical protein SDC9_57301 [bioreactor metagenome]|uniref:EamA domain-containing protein n=1 Tax=bioreactor metagenome TaxID=1076179 RepID=A0A644X9N9_9ZZZZ
MKKYLGPFYLLMAFSLAGTSVISAKAVSGKLGVFTITSASLIYALLFLLPACGRKIAQSLRAMSAKDRILLVFQAVFGIFLFRLFLINGLLHTSSAEAGILTGATPAITVIFAAILLKEPLSGKKLFGIFSTVCGILILQGLFQAGSSFSLEHFGGNLLVLCAAASESTFNLISRVFAVKNEFCHKTPFPPLVQTTLVSIAALILCSVPALLENPARSLSLIGPSEWLALGWYGVFVTAIAFFCWYEGIRRCGAMTAAAFSGMMPFTSMLLSVVILGEKAHWQQWLGGLLVISGMVLIGSGTTPAGVSEKTVKNIN